MLGARPFSNTSIPLGADSTRIRDMLAGLLWVRDDVFAVEVCYVVRLLEELSEGLMYSSISKKPALTTVDIQAPVASFHSYRRLLTEQRSKMNPDYIYENLRK